MNPRMLRSLPLCMGALLFAGSLTAQRTEATTTAPVGAWLLEADMLGVTVDRHTPFNDGLHYRSTLAGSLLFSTGLTEKFDLQFGYELWREEHVTGGGVNERYRGGGDGWLRAKWNFAGDETEGKAWALLPYFKLPLAGDDLGNGAIEPGLVLVYGRPVGTDSAVNVNLGGDWLDDTAGGRDLAIYASAAWTRMWSETWSGYTELSVWLDRADSSNWWGEAGLGVVRTIGERGWLDLAIYAGLTKAAPDISPIIRVGWQF